MLALDLGLGQRPGQAEAGGLVGQGAVLPEPALDLAGGGGQAGGVVARGRQPVDGDLALGAEGQRLGRDLGVAVQEQRVDLADGVLGGRLAVGGRDDERLAGAADAGAGGDDVEAGAVAVGREEADRLAAGLLGLADLLGQADRGERAADAEPLVLGDRGPLGRLAEPPAPRRSPRPGRRGRPRRSGRGR